MAAAQDKPVEEQLAECQRLVENLKLGQVHRETIDQAIGILMAPGGVSAAVAFKVLIDASQRENRKLRDIATDLVENTVERSTPTPGNDRLPGA